MRMSIALPARCTEGLSVLTLAVALLVSAHNLTELARGHAAAMRCGGPAPGLACRLLCWIGDR